MRNVLVVAVLLASSTTASVADPPRYSRKQTVDVPVHLSNRVKPTPATPPRARAPVVSADDLMLIEDRTQPIRREQEAILTRLIHDTPDTDEDKPEYMFRLAEHYAKQLRFWRLKAVEATITRD